MPRFVLTLPLLAASALLACGSDTQPPFTTAGLGDEGTETGAGDTLPNPDPTFDSLDGGMTASTDTGAATDDGDTDSGPSTAGDVVDTGDAEDTGDTGDTGEASTSDAGSSSDGAETTGSGASLDVSNWVVTQANSDREFVLPPGTILDPGTVVVIGRDATQAQFENWWGVVFGPDVLYFDAADEFPVINGDETYTIIDDGGAVVDGPTPAISVGENFQRIDASLPGTDATAWEISVNPNAEGLPGTVAASPPDSAGLMISEFSDATGTQLFVYEFVELQYVTP